MTPPRPLGRSIADAFAAQAVSATFTLVTAVVTMRVLGPHEYGVLAIVFGFATVAALLCDLGLSMAAARFAAERFESPGAVARVARDALAVKVGAGRDRRHRDHGAQRPDRPHAGSRRRCVGPSAHGRGGRGAGDLRQRDRNAQRRPADARQPRGGLRRKRRRVPRHGRGRPARRHRRGGRGRPPDGVHRRCARVGRPDGEGPRAPAPGAAGRQHESAARLRGSDRRRRGRVRRVHADRLRAARPARRPDSRGAVRRRRPDRDAPAVPGSRRRDRAGTALRRSGGGRGPCSPGADARAPAAPSGRRGHPGRDLVRLRGAAWSGRRLRSLRRDRARDVALPAALGAGADLDDDRELRGPGQTAGWRGARHRRGERGPGSRSDPAFGAVGAAIGTDVAFAVYVAAHVRLCRTIGLQLPSAHRAGRYVVAIAAGAAAGWAATTLPVPLALPLSAAAMPCAALAFGLVDHRAITAWIGREPHAAKAR